MPVTRFHQLEAALAAPRGNVKNLSLCRSSGPAMKQIPDEIFELSSLEVLQVEGHELEELTPRVAELPRLKELSVARNKLTALPEALCGMKKLRILNIRENPIRELPDVFFEMKQLNVFQHDFVPKVSESVKAIAPARRAVAPEEIPDGPAAEPLRALLRGEPEMIFFNWINKLQEQRGAYEAVRDYIRSTLDVDEIPGPFRLRGILPAMRSLTTVRDFFGKAAPNDALFPMIQVGEDFAGRPLWMSLREGRVVFLEQPGPVYHPKTDALQYGSYKVPGQLADCFAVRGLMNIEGLLYLQQVLPGLGMASAADIGARKLKPAQKRELLKHVMIATMRSAKSLHSLLKYRYTGEASLVELFGPT